MSDNIKHGSNNNMKQYHSRDDKENSNDNILTKDNIKKWIENGPDKDLMSIVEISGKNIKERGLTTSQFRNIFNKIKEIEAKGFEKMESELIMLKPLTAYSYKRNSNEGFKHLKQIIDDAIDTITKENDKDKKKMYFKNFVKLLEAILSYHKYYGGR